MSIESGRRGYCGSRLVAVCLLFGTMSVFAFGCSSPPKPSDSARAGEVLRSALDAWKAGKSTDDLKALTPPVYVGDARWQSGRKLKDYQIKGEGEFLETSVNFKVSLRLEKDSKPTEVIYYVSTNPALTVTAAE